MVWTKGMDNPRKKDGFYFRGEMEVILCKCQHGFRHVCSTKVWVLERNPVARGKQLHKSIIYGVISHTFLFCLCFYHVQACHAYQ